MNNHSQNKILPCRILSHPIFQCAVWTKYSGHTVQKKIQRARTNQPVGCNLAQLLGKVQLLKWWWMLRISPLPTGVDQTAQFASDKKYKNEVSPYKTKTKFPQERKLAYISTNKFHRDDCKSPGTDGRDFPRRFLSSDGSCAVEGKAVYWREKISLGRCLVFTIARLPGLPAVSSNPFPELLPFLHVLAELDHGSPCGRPRTGQDARPLRSLTLGPSLLAG